MFAYINLSCFSSVFSKKKSQFCPRKQPFKKALIVQEELDGIDIDDIANLEDSPRFVFINEEYENLIVDGGELNRSINLKKKSGILQQFIGVHDVTNALQMRVFLQQPYGIL